MSVKPPPRWTARSLTSMFLPHLFRNSRNPAESTGVRKEKVPLDAHENHMFIKRKTEKMVKSIRLHFGLTAHRPSDAPKDALWSIATGEWVPSRNLEFEYIFPFSLGPMVAQHVSPKISFRGYSNGMLVPQTVRGAFNEWTLTIAPEKSCRHERKPSSFLFRTLDSEAPSLRKPVWPNSDLKVRGLDGEPLHFRNNARLSPHACYFHSCCALWKSTFLEDPDQRPEDFWERFQLRMDDLWGNVGSRKSVLNIFKPPELVNVEEKDQETTLARDEILFMNEAMGQADERQECVEEHDDGDDDDLDIGVLNDGDGGAVQSPRTLRG